MNERAKELGMNDTVFKNCHGIDEDGHVTSAHDIAVMSRELIKHEKIFEYTTIWMDTLRDGTSELVNTNKLVRFYDDVGDHFDEKILHGPIHLQLQEALDYIRSQVIVEKVVKVDDKAEANRAYNYPYTAIEEVLSNAVYHKSYDDRNPIEVRIEPTSIIVYSLAGPMPPITNDDLKNERVLSRNYRNRRIGDFLKELDLTEGRCTGIPTIQEELAKNGSPRAFIETDEDRSYFITRLFIHEEFTKDANQSKMNEVDEKNERSLSEVLSEVLIKKDFDRIMEIVKAGIEIIEGEKV